MIDSIVEGLWHDQFDLRGPLGVQFRGRMVVARLAGGGLWIWSPIPIDEARAAALAELGPVEHLVAPNAFHYLHFAAAAERYGQARRWVAPGLAKKRPSLEYDERLGDEAPSVWAEDFEQLRVGGMPKVDEVVFLHRPTRTLLLTDLVFNIREPRGLMTGLVMRLAGTHKRLAQSRLLRSMIKDRQAAAASAQRILSWEFDRVVVAHGEIIEDDAHARLTEALGWMLEGAARAS